MSRNIQVGQWYVDLKNGRVYVVSHLADRYWLINIHTGRSYGGPHIEAETLLPVDGLDFALVERLP